MNETEMMLALRSWQTINKALPTMSEDDCKRAITMEMQGKCRKDVVLRVHQRFGTLRTMREREELLTTLGMPVFMIPELEGTT